MKDQIKFLILMVVITVVGSLTLTYAQSSSQLPIAAPTGFPPPPDGFRHGGPGPGHDPIERLNLTDEQRESIGLIKLATRDAAREYESKMRAADEQIRLLVESAAFTVEKATPLVRAKTDAMASVELKRLAADAEIYKLLTSEQKTQLAQLREQRPPMPPGGGPRPAARN